MNQGMYVENYNYHTMYNTMENNIIHNLIPIDTFIYTFQQVEELYNFLTPIVLNGNVNENIIEPVNNYQYIIRNIINNITNLNNHNNIIHIIDNINIDQI